MKAKQATSNTKNIVSQKLKGLTKLFQNLTA
jgi:hypothetical protein